MAKLFLLHLLGAMLGVGGSALTLGLWNSNTPDQASRRRVLDLLTISLAMMAFGIALLLE